MRTAEAGGFFYGGGVAVCGGVVVDYAKYNFIVLHSA